MATRSEQIRKDFKITVGDVPPFGLLARVGYDKRRQNYNVIVRLLDGRTACEGHIPKHSRRKREDHEQR
ncbi:MAG: hypothetical protein ABIO94_13505 [Opitutaceae bacterium]